MDGQIPAGGPLPGDDGPVGPSPLGPSPLGPSPFDPGLVPGDDFDLDGHFEWLVREIDAGRLQAPPEPDIEGPAISISLSDACDVDPELLAAMCGPDGLGGEAVPAEFGQDRAADAMRPGPLLAALTAQTASSPGSLTDNELIGVLQAARRMANLAAYQQTVAIAEFARRRQAEFEAAKARGVPVGCRDGEFPGEELTMELVATGPYTSARIDTAIELAARLPRTLAGMADGLIDLTRACTIASRTRSMTNEDAAYADEVLAATAPGLRPDQLARKAAALELKLAPEAVKARKELARHLDQRVEARREESGNASLAGRELGTADVIASKAYIDAIAVKLRNSGLIEGGLGRLRALALVDLTQGRNPLDRIKPQRATNSADTNTAPGGKNTAPGGKPPADPSGHAPESATNSADASTAPGGKPPADPSGHVPESATNPADALEPTAGPSGDPLSDADSDGWPDWDDNEAQRAGYRDAPADDLDPSLGHVPAGSGAPVPLPALINLLVPAGTLLGWSTAPGQAAGWGLLDADEIRALIQAASQHPRTRWCFTLTAPDGTAIAHACATGRHPWKPPDPANPQRKHNPGGAPTPGQAAQLADLLRSFSVTFEPIARDTCDHRHEEDRYVPSRKLRHLLRARNQTCTAPACNAQALYCDIDHTIPYPDGPTDECNTNPKCRRHHRTKQAPGWKTTQPTPDTTTWITPSGRAHTTAPTAYDL